MVPSKTLYKQTQGMQGGTWVYEMFIATGEKVSLYISIEDWRLSVLEKVVGNPKVFSVEPEWLTGTLIWLFLAYQWLKFQVGRVLRNG